MALKPLNSVGGFSVGEIPANVILANADITANKGSFVGNVAVSNSNPAYGILTDNLYYANGVPWDLQEAAGSNTQVQFNNNNDFGASANFTFDTATNILAVTGNINATNANIGSGNIDLYANGEINTTGLITTSANVDANNVNITNELDANTANFSGNVVLSGATVTIDNDLDANTANFSGNITSLNANLGNLVTANYVNVAVDVNATGNVSANNANIGSGNIDLYANGEISASTANFSGNVYAAYFVGNVEANITITAPNTAVLFSNGGLVEGSNNFTFDFASNVLTANGTANITGNTSVGGILTDNYYYANGAPVDFQQPAGSNTQIQFNDNDDFGASANLTFDFATNTLTVAGNANITTVNTSDIVGTGTDVTINANGYVSTFYGANGLVDLPGALTANGNLTVDNADLGNLAVANFIDISSNAQVNNLTVNLEIAGNTANFSGNVVVNNLTTNLELAGNTANFSGNATFSGDQVTVDNELSGNTANFSGNVTFSGTQVTVDNELSGNTANFSGNITSLNADLGNLAVANYVNVAQQINGNIANFSGNLTALNADLGNLALANYVNVANDLNVIGNVNAGNLVGTFANGTSNVKIYQDANVEISVAGNANVATVTGTGFLVAGNIQSTTGNITANGNVTANGFLIGANASITGEADVGSLKTANITAASGDITINAAGADGTINLAPTGNGTVDVGLFKITQLADPTNPHDAATKEYVDAMAGEGLDIHTPVRVEAESALNATYAQGGTTPTVTDIANNKEITFSASHGLSANDGIVFTNSFNGLTAGEAYWVFSVVNATTITVKDGYYGAEVTTLTNGTGLSQASRANPGVGATLTNAGANAALSIDGIALSTSDRVLVYTQSNAYENGVYTVTTVGDGSTAWVLTRATDFDKYIPDSPNGLSKGSYVFVTSGVTGAGESYVMTAPIGEVIIGTDNITFTQFSAAGSYTAGSGINITGTTISANTDGVTTAIVSGNIVVKDSANLTTPNIGDATFSSLTWNSLSNGNVTANNLSISSIANITLDLTVGGNIQANGTISANANVSGLNLTTSGNVQATGNVLANNVNANTLITVPTANVSNIVNAGNVDITYELSGNTANFSGNIVVNNATVNLELSGNTANFSSNVIVNNLTTNLELAGNTANFSGNVILPNLTVNLELAGNTANFSGNVVAANFETAGEANVADLNVTANVVSDLLPNANLTLNLGDTSQRWADAYVGNVDASGNVNAGNLVTAGEANVADLNVTANVVSDLLPNANLTLNLGETGQRWATVYTGDLNASGNITAAGSLEANNFSANNVTANTSVTVGNTVIEWGSVTTTSISTATIAQAPYSGVTGIDFIVKGEDSTGAKYSMAHVTAVTDGSNVDYTTYGTVYLGGTTGTLSVSISGSNVELQVTPSSSNSTVWTTQYRLV